MMVTIWIVAVSIVVVVAIGVIGLLEYLSNSND